jgi:hypothetical protein
MPQLSSQFTRAMKIHDLVFLSLRPLRSFLNASFRRARFRNDIGKSGQGTGFNAMRLRSYLGEEIRCADRERLIVLLLNSKYCLSKKKRFQSNP